MNFFYRLERTSARIGRAFFWIARFLFYFHAGKMNGYPTCCVTNFAFDGARRKRYIAVRRGAVEDGTKDKLGGERVYVPCWFHRYIWRSPYWKAYGDRSKVGQLPLFEMEPQKLSCTPQIR